MDIKDILGRATMESLTKYKDGRILLGCRIKKYDYDGNLVSEKEVWSMSVGYKDRPMSEIEAFTYISNG